MGNYSIALSGLSAEAQALNVVSNDLANLNTTGFKGSTASFQDLVTEAMQSSSPNGAGVSSVAAEQDFTQGTVQVTNGAYDAAIEGSGFFVVQNSQGEQLYTRAGNLNVNSAGNLVDGAGSEVLGWTATNGVVNPSGAVGPITIPVGMSTTPVASTQFTIAANLNAAATTTGATSTFSTPVQVVDSLGETQTLTVTFTNTGPGAWSYNVTIPGADVSGGTAGTPSSLTTGTLNFDSSGNLTSPAAPATVPIAISGLSDGAATLNVTWNLDDTSGNPAITGYAQTSASSGTTVDGTAAAQLSQVSIANGGTIVAQFSNGTQQVVGQIAFAGIENPDSLVSTGQNEYSLTATSATPSIGAAGTGGRGQIEAGALETSNVDIGTEFTRLMTYQNSYQADSKAITTIDQMQQDLMQMKQ